MPREPDERPVSPLNPCPFLRALVTQGLLPDGTVRLGDVAATLDRVAAADAGARSTAG